uniref:Zinc finger homeobox 4 n=1 Tax=Neogobius melanostomus TaxID=47308 RepID=A0A8C6WL64_9GOBI
MIVIDPDSILLGFFYRRDFVRSASGALFYQILLYERGPHRGRLFPHLISFNKKSLFTSYFPLFCHAYSAFIFTRALFYSHASVFLCALSSAYNLHTASLQPNRFSLFSSAVNSDLSAELRLAGGQLMADDLSLVTAGGMGGIDPNLRVYQCAVCNCYSSDSLEALNAHVNAERSLPEEEWRCVVGDVYQCKLCSYNTQLKANFQLHCKTDKHMQKHQLVAHIKEGGKANQWRLKCVAIGNPVHLKCNACDYYSNSVDKLRLHTTNQRHEAVIRLYKHLQKQDSAYSPESCVYYCTLCDYSTRARLNLVQHARSARHQQNEGLRKLQLHQQGLSGEEELTSNRSGTGSCMCIVGNVCLFFPDETGEDSERSPRSSSRPGLTDRELTEGRKSDSKLPHTHSLHPPIQCPYCNYSSKDANLMQLHVMSQHSMQPVIRCPLCQDVLSNKIHLQLHLTHLHSVAPDCVEKLIMTVLTNFFLHFILGNNLKDEEKNEMEVQCEELKPPKEASEAPDWNKASNVGHEKSSDALQDHLTELQRLQQQQQQLSVSDRHVYKYRCNHCSLAFKTMQKLQIHSQYHAIRAATMCSLCQRSFRTFLALRKHLENGHPELSEAEVQQLVGNLPINGDITESEVRALEEAQAFEHDLDKDDELDQEEKPSPTGSDSGSLLDDMAEPKRTLPFRKGPNFTMEKFLDPSRPYKCTVCKESFTQKNILLVHYNSVSHLHKLKKVLQEASSPVPQETSNSVDNKPFKCNICNVAYSQSSTLEIHMRSVLHQTKARTAKSENSSSNSGSVPAKSPAPSTQGNNTNSDTARSGTPANKENSMESKEVNSSNTKQSTSIEHISAQSSSHQSLQASTQLQLQLQHELQQQAAFFQPQFLNPAFFPHFPMTPEALLQFQQPQFLFPFYIPGAEFNLSPELALQSAAAFGMPGLTGSFLEDLKQQMQQQHQLQQVQAQQQAQQQQQASQSQKSQQNIKSKSESIAVSDVQMSREAEEQLERQEHKAKMENGDLLSDNKENKDIKKSKFSEPLIPPPRIVSGARGNAAKALLENFGFELVIQYNENRQKIQKKNKDGTEQVEINTDKLECGMCGKLFSNMLILKSHQEHVHSQFFPYGELEKFAQQYREAYDKLYPINPSSPETPPPPPPPPPPPAPASVNTPQPASTSMPKPQTPAPSPAAAAPHQPSHRAPTPQPPPPPPPPAAPPAPPQVQLPVPLDMPLFPSLMMQSVQHPGLPPQLTLQLPGMDSLSTDLTQLCQQQLALDPNFLRQSQFKRPRTRITDDQLKILRANFDINNSPNEEQIQEMSEKSGLPQKVIKHWFRNTLFKERQRSKDSPYNFNIPPITTLEDIRMEPQVSAHDYRTEQAMNKRSSRTRFTDYQLRVLQDFFDTNAYPKDDEIEQLSTVLNLPTRVIVVWFQNARQKARKSYENQADSKDSEKKELTNERYIRTSNMQYQCKKCNIVFPRIFDLITHQKKQCYKDEDEDANDETQSEDYNDSYDLNLPKSHMFSEYSRQPHGTATSSGSSSPTLASPHTSVGKISPKPEPFSHEFETKQTENAPSPVIKSLPEPRPSKACTPQPPPPQKATQPPMSRPHSQPQAATVPSSSLSMALSTLTNSLSHQMLQYQCEQCKIAFPTMELWQEHQHMHFLAAQNQFLHSQFLERPMDMPYMIFDPNNPLMASHLLSGGLTQIPSQSSASLASAGAMKRKLDDKDEATVDKDSGNSGEEQHRTSV